MNSLVALIARAVEESTSPRLSAFCIIMRLFMGYEFRLRESVRMLLLLTTYTYTAAVVLDDTIHTLRRYYQVLNIKIPVSFKSP